MGGAGGTNGVGEARGACGTGVGGAKIAGLSGEGLRLWRGVTRRGWGGGLGEGRDDRGKLRAGFGLSRSPPALRREGTGFGFLGTCLNWRGE